MIAARAPAAALARKGHGSFYAAGFAETGQALLNFLKNNDSKDGDLKN